MDDGDDYIPTISAGIFRIIVERLLQDLDESVAFGAAFDNDRFYSRQKLSGSKLEPPCILQVISATRLAPNEEHGHCFSVVLTDGVNEVTSLISPSYLYCDDDDSIATFALNDDNGHLITTGALVECTPQIQLSWADAAVKKRAGPKQASRTTLKLKFGYQESKRGLRVLIPGEQFINSQPLLVSRAPGASLFECFPTLPGLFEFWFSVSFPYGGNDYYLRRGICTRSRSCPPCLQFDVRQGISRHIISFLGQGRVGASSLITCCRGMAHATVLIFEPTDPRIAWRKELLAIEVRRFKALGSGLGTAHQSMMRWLQSCGPVPLRERLLESSTLHGEAIRLLGAQKCDASASSSTTEKSSGTISLPAGLCAQLNQLHYRIQKSTREQTHESCMFYRVDYPFILLRAPKFSSTGSFPRYLPFSKIDSATFGLEHSSDSAHGRTCKLYTDVMPLCLRDLAHATLRQLHKINWGGEDAAASLAKLGASAIVIAEQNFGGAPAEALPLSHSTAWFLLDTCSQAWPSPLTFLDRSMPLKHAAAVLMRELAPQTAPWVFEQGILSIVLEFATTPWIAVSQELRLVSREFNRLAVDFRKRTTLGVEFTRKGLQPLGAGTKETHALVQTTRLVANSSSITFDSMEIPEGVFDQCFSFGLPNLVEFRVGRCTGFQGNSLSKIAYFAADMLLEICLCDMDMEEHALQPLGDACSNLKTCIASNLGNTSLAPLVSCFNLRVLIAKRSAGASDFLTLCHGAKGSGAAFPSGLEVLDLAYSDCNAAGEALWIIPSIFPEVRRLNLLGCGVDTDGLVDQGMSNLEAASFASVVHQNAQVEPVSVLQMCPRLSMWGNSLFRWKEKGGAPVANKWWRPRENKMLSTDEEAQGVPPTFSIEWLVWCLEGCDASLLEVLPMVVTVKCTSASFMYSLFDTKDKHLPRVVSFIAAKDNEMLLVRAGAYIVAVDGFRPNESTAFENSMEYTLGECQLDIEQPEPKVAIWRILLDLLHVEYLQVFASKEPENYTACVQDDLWCRALNLLLEQLCFRGNGSRYLAAVLISTRVLTQILRFYSESTLSAFMRLLDVHNDQPSPTLVRVVKHFEVAMQIIDEGEHLLQGNGEAQYDCPGSPKTQEHKCLFDALAVVCRLSELFVLGLRPSSIAGSDHLADLPRLARKLSGLHLVPTLLRVIKTTVCRTARISGCRRQRAFICGTDASHSRGFHFHTRCDVSEAHTCALTLLKWILKFENKPLDIAGGGFDKFFDVIRSGDGCPKLFASVLLAEATDMPDVACCPLRDLHPFFASIIMAEHAELVGAVQDAIIQKLPPASSPVEIIQNGGPFSHSFKRDPLRSEEAAAALEVICTLMPIGGSGDDRLSKQTLANAPYWLSVALRSVLPVNYEAHELFCDAKHSPALAGAARVVALLSKPTFAVVILEKLLSELDKLLDSSEIESSPMRASLTKSLAIATFRLDEDADDSGAAMMTSTALDNLVVTRALGTAAATAARVANKAAQEAAEAVSEAMHEATAAATATT